MTVASTAGGPGDFRVTLANGSATETTETTESEETFGAIVVATGWRTSGNVEEQLSEFVSGGTNSAGFNANLKGYTFNGDSIYRDQRGLYLSAETGHTRVLRSDVEGVNRYNIAASGNADKTTGFARCVSFGM